MIRQSTSEDLNNVISLLKNVSLPFEDIHLHFDNFLVLEIEGNIVGAIGMEVYEEIALLRSLAVSKAFQKKGLGQKLYCKLFEKMQAMEILEIYLLTETAENFFSKQGFQRIPRDSTPLQIQQSNEFTTLCPSTAVCMCKRLN